MKKKETDRKQNGAITVEATLILLMFFTAFILLMNLTNYVRMQTLMQYTADQTAKELSRYGYLLEKMGVLDKLQQTAGQTQAVQQKGEDLMSGFTWMEDALNGVGGTSISQGANKLDQSVSIIQDYANDPQSLINDLTTMAKGTMEAELAKGATRGLSSIMVHNQLESSNESINEYLLDKGVVGGLAGLKFEGSTYDVSEQTISVVISYEMKTQIGFFELEQKTYKVKGVTRIWSGE